LDFQNAITLTSSFSAFSTCFGTASATQTFTISGAGLSNDIVINAPTGFEISNGSPVSGYNTSMTLNASGGGSNKTVENTTIYIRIAATTAVGSYNGSITASSTGVSSKTLSIEYRNCYRCSYISKCWC